MLNVYLASPFFNDRERSLVDRIQTMLPTIGYDCYSPSRDGIVLKPDSGPEDRLRVLEENKRAIKECNLVVANTDGDSLSTILPDKVLRALFSQLQEYAKESWINHNHFTALGKLVSRDPGTYWELGYAHSLHIPIITYSELGFDINVMIGESVIAHTKNWEELVEALTLYQKAVADPRHWEEIRTKFKRSYKVF